MVVSLFQLVAFPRDNIAFFASFAKFSLGPSLNLPKLPVEF